MEKKGPMSCPTLTDRVGGAAFSGVRIEHVRLFDLKLLLDLQKECGIYLLLVTHDIGVA